MLHTLADFSVVIVGDPLFLLLLQVIVNTEVQACRFTGEAKYMQLIVYVDNMCNPSLKDVSFSA